MAAPLIAEPSVSTESATTPQNESSTIYMVTDVAAPKDPAPEPTPGPPEIPTDRLVIEPECAVVKGWDAGFVITYLGDPVDGAEVTANLETIGTTDTDGRVSFNVPFSEEITIRAVSGGIEGELFVDTGLESG